MKKQHLKIVVPFILAFFFVSVVCCCLKHLAPQKSINICCHHPSSSNTAQKAHHPSTNCDCHSIVGVLASNEAGLAERLSSLADSNLNFHLSASTSFALTQPARALLHFNGPPEKSVSSINFALTNPILRV